VTNVLADTIPGIRVVKAFAQEAARPRASAMPTAQPRGERPGEPRLVAVLAHRDAADRTRPAVVWAFGIWQVSKDQITVGVLTAFLAYIGRFYTRLDSMSRIVSVTQKAAAGAKRIFDILDHVSSVPEPSQPGEARPDVAAASNCAAWLPLRQPRVLKRRRSRDRARRDDRPGRPQRLGQEHAGEPDLPLLRRDEGAILVDGTDIRALPVADYRRHIGLVLQEPFLFFGTIADNIAYGKPDATRAEIVAAARAAHAHEFILRLPHGYDSLVGERGQGSRAASASASRSPARC
jgi:ATP-binding cassette subfamily B protein